jgi:hypothetical protein
VVKECEQANERIYALAMVDPESKSTTQPLTSLALASLDSMSSSSVTAADQISAFSNLNSFDSRFIPPKGPLREEWAKYVQLGLCARWALDHVYTDGKKVIYTRVNKTVQEKLTSLLL